MKKAYILGITAALVLGTTAVFAIGIPKTGNSIADKAIDVGKDQVKAVVMDDLNKKLTELTAQCKCNQTKGLIEGKGCSLDKVKKEISMRQEGVKTFLNKNFRIKTEVAQACWVDLENKIPDDSTYWSWWNSQWVKTESVVIQAVK